MASWLEKMGGARTGAVDALPPEIGAAEVLVDCSYPVAHAGAHVAVAGSRRLICTICHARPGTPEFDLQAAA